MRTRAAENTVMGVFLEEAGLPRVLENSGKRKAFQVG